MLFLVLALFATAAYAADIVCLEKNALGAESDYCIMKATLGNGQVIHYLSTDDTGWHRMEDVNFDGYDDFVPFVVKGARNLCAVFYLYNPQTGLYESLNTPTDDTGYWNHSLDADKRYVISHVQDGWQYGEKRIYAWEGNTLVLLRSATVSQVHTFEYDDTGMTDRWDFTRNEMIVWDRTKELASEQVLYHEIYPDDDPAYEEHVALLEAALWDGLR